MSKTLVAWFSATGSASILAHNLQKVFDADLFQIVPESPYSVADLNWHDPKSRSSLEKDDPASRPAIEGKVENMGEYGLVLVGFPIWWYQAPRIIETFIEAYDFSGKYISVFATSGGSGLGNTEKILSDLAPKAIWLPGKRFAPTASEAELKAWENTLRSDMK